MEYGPPLVSWFRAPSQEQSFTIWPVGARNHEEYSPRMSLGERAKIKIIKIIFLDYVTILDF